MRIAPLDRKLFRDLLAMKGQAFAIAMVVAAGVAMYVMYLSSSDSLLRTRDAYYERQRFGDVFGSLKRAPLRIAAEIASIPDVSAVETRVVAGVTLDLPDLDEPATGRLVSVPANRRPLVNDLFLRRGRWIERGRPDEVIASEGFVIANNLELGDRVPAVLNGRLRNLTIVGVALSPEFVYSIRPGEMVPDDRRYGVLWMDEQALAAAFDMEGGFNDVVLALAPGAETEEVVSRLDRILEPYGGLGAVPRALQISHWMLTNEMRQLETFGFMLPLVFMAVAAFILNVALTRALALQRPQIAALKALGYTNRAIGWHYLKWALAIGLAGVVLGVHPRGDDGQPAHRALQHVLPLPGAAVQRSTWRRGWRDDAHGRLHYRGGIHGGAACGPRSTRRGHAARTAGALQAVAARNALRLTAPRHRGAHGVAECDASPGPRRGVGLRHRIRRGHPDDRFRVQRCGRSPHAHAVLGGGTSGRDRHVCRAARRVRAVRTGAHAGRRRRRDAAHCGRTRAIGTSRSIHLDYRRAAESTLQAHCRSRWPSGSPAAIGSGAVHDARCAYLASLPATRSCSRCSRDSGRPTARR